MRCSVGAGRRAREALSRARKASRDAPRAPGPGPPTRRPAKAGAPDVAAQRTASAPDRRGRFPGSVPTPGRGGRRSPPDHRARRGCVARMGSSPGADGVPPRLGWTPASAPPGYPGRAARYLGGHAGSLEQARAGPSLQDTPNRAVAPLNRSVRAFPASRFARAPRRPDSVRGFGIVRRIVADWMYVGLCVLGPAAWGGLMYLVFDAIDRRRSKASSPPRPPVDYSI